MDVSRLGGWLPQEQHARSGAGNGHLAAVRADAFGEGLDESAGHWILRCGRITSRRAHPR